MQNRVWGFDLLKIISMFGVIFIHVNLLPDMNMNAFGYLVQKVSYCAVPAFFIISFYFYEKTIFNIDDLKKRIKRLLIPYFFWFTFCGIVLSCIDMILRCNNILLGDNYRLIFPRDYLLQLITGSVMQYNHPMWFMVDLIIGTLLIFFVYKERNIYCILALIPVCFVAEYTILPSYFTNIPYEFAFSFLRLFEVLPYACIGIVLARFKILDWGLEHIFIIIVITILSLVMFLNVENDYGNNWGYGGGLLFVVSVLIVQLFYIISSIRIDDRLGKMIYYPLKMNMGIYSVHWIIIFEIFILHNILPKYVYYTNNPLVFVVLAYMLSLLTCSIIRMIVGAKADKLLQ